MPIRVRTRPRPIGWTAWRSAPTALRRRRYPGRRRLLPLSAARLPECGRLASAPTCSPRVYGEENDFCLRARRLGWRNVALTGIVRRSPAAASAFWRQRRASAGPQQPDHRAASSRLRRADRGFHRTRSAGGAAPADRPAALARTRTQMAAVGDPDHAQRRRRRRTAPAARCRQRIVEAGRRPIVLRPAETADGEPAIAVRDGMARRPSQPGLRHAAGTAGAAPSAAGRARPERSKRIISRITRRPSTI